MTATVLFYQLLLLLIMIFGLDSFLPAPMYSLMRKFRKETSFRVMEQNLLVEDMELVGDKGFQEVINPVLHGYKFYQSNSSSLLIPLEKVEKDEPTIIPINEAYYRIVTELVAKGAEIKPDEIMETLLSQQDSDGMVSFPLHEPEGDDITNDPDYGPIFREIWKNIQKPVSSFKELLASLNKRFPNQLRQWRAEAIAGIDAFKAHNLIQAKRHFDSAAALNVNQTLQQRGMLLYYLEDYQEALNQFLLDIHYLEKDKLLKACQLRLWASACYNRLGQPENAVEILDVNNTKGYNLEDETAFMNTTMQFYAGLVPVEEMLEILSLLISPISMEEDELEREDEEYMLAKMEFLEQFNEKYKDIEGFYYYGNFYVALYYDSIGDLEMMNSFLEYPRTSNRCNTEDLWYHLPRILYDLRCPQTEIS